MDTEAQPAGRHSRGEPITAALSRGSSTRQRATLVLSPTSMRDVPTIHANTSLYLSIESRLQLKSRLIKLQQELRQLLVQAELTWMRCFAGPRTTVAHTTALQMVQLGEGVLPSLSRAFDLAAGTATAPLSEYQALVMRVESEIATFQAFLANVNQLQPQGQIEAVADKEDYDNEHEACGEKKARGEAITYLNRPVNMDLPSMQRYCKHVAPPYSSYLVGNIANKITKAKKRVV